MTNFRRLTATAAMTLTAALSMTAGIALAGDNNVSANQIVNALQPKPLTRSLSRSAAGRPCRQGQGGEFRSHAA